GAASGIGLGMTEALAHRGMRVVMADVEQEPLAREAERLQKLNFDVSPCVTDVSEGAAIESLLAHATGTYGNVHVLCNNAGVSGGGGAEGIWSQTQEDWDWVMGVNFYGVVNGIRAFVPHMLAHGEESHIVNTSSILGLTTGGGSIYGVTKHAVARLTEGLYHDLSARSANIGVTLLCPGLIATNIITSARNRPAGLESGANPDDPDQAERIRQMDKYFKAQGMAPREVGELVAEAIAARQFYLLTHPENMQGVERRFDDLLHLRNPAPPVPMVPGN
ncbi:MAG: SDR family NAD(P)-dependent oxidoreductase, partial [Pseudomonadales bacterium]|nr:SDR family NAD(P)-dependent oxidoreductase [Pseudomonadales bacterium]